MSYLQLVYLHLGTVLPAFVLGTIIMFRRKGTPVHKLTGKVYMALMLVTAVGTLFLPAVVGPQLFNHFGFIHLFSLLVLVTVPGAIFSIRKGNVEAHKHSMIGMYIGAIVIAGLLSFAPGRLLNQWLMNLIN